MEEGKPENPEKNPRSRERTNNKLNPHERLSTAIEPGSQRWEARAHPLCHLCSQISIAYECLQQNEGVKPEPLPLSVRSCLKRQQEKARSGCLNPVIPGSTPTWLSNWIILSHNSSTAFVHKPMVSPRWACPQNYCHYY